MAEFLVSNFARVDAYYDEEKKFQSEPQASNYTHTAVIEGTTTINKAVDKEIWTDGNLTYTLTVKNNTNELPLYHATVFDQLDSHIVYNNDAATTPNHDITATVDESNLMTITFNDTIQPQEEVTIVFTVSKV